MIAAAKNEYLTACDSLALAIAACSRLSGEADKNLVTTYHALGQMIQDRVEELKMENQQRRETAAQNRRESAGGGSNNAKGNKGSFAKTAKFCIERG